MHVIIKQIDLFGQSIMRKPALLLLGACQRDRPSTFYDRQFLRCDICDICHSLRLSMVKHNAIVDILDGGRRGKDGQALCALQKYHLDISKIQHHQKADISAKNSTNENVDI